MNVEAVEKKTILIKEPTLSNTNLYLIYLKFCIIYKMLNAQNHLDYCYCNQKKPQCWLCKFDEYVKYNDFKNELLRYRENEYRMLNLADKFWFYIRKIKRDVEQLNANEIIALNFFNEQYKNGEMCFEDIIKNDIIKFNEEYMK